MIAQAQPQATRVAGFRTRLLVAMMLVVSAVTLLALYFAQRSLAANVEDDLKREFQAEFEGLHHAQELRRIALLERCRALVRKQRIVGALEELPEELYPNADIELSDVMARVTESGSEPTRGLHAQFYRFLDRKGAVIPAANPRVAGALAPADVAKLALPALPDKPQIGYVAWRHGDSETAVSEIIAMPIISSETGEIISALVLGAEPYAVGRRGVNSGMKSGILLEGVVHSEVLPPMEETILAATLRGEAAGPLRVVLDGTPHLVFSKQLNPGSLYPPASEVCVYSLADLVARQRKLGWQVLGAGTMLLLFGLFGSHVASTRLSAPVEKLAVDSEENRTQRVRAEAALEMTSAELQRSARFSADASHQLKTPVTVLRAGLEELMAREHLKHEECAEISALIHQTYRLSSLIEDLLLLSRMDAGRLKLEFVPVNLSQLIEASLDDLSALPDDLELVVETDFPAELHIAGEKRYTAIILQNLLENARKYNRRGGHIRLTAMVDGENVRLLIANTGKPISAEGQAHIFERFHRGVMGENVPGYGLGLNLARELARLHQGDLRLIRSDATWTEFEVHFRWAPPILQPSVDS